jgi:hypothetical protein
MSCVGPKLLVAVALPVVLVQFGNSVFAEVPPRSPGGQTLAVPAEQLERGEVYYVSPGAGTQLAWTADAPLMRLTATCNRVVGYFVTPFDLEVGQTPLLAGALRIPVASLSTGIGSYDRELHGESALDAAEYPEITLEIASVAGAKPVGEEGGKKSYTLTAACRFTVKDKVLDLDLPLRLTLSPFTWQTMPLGMGDALILRTEFDVKRADLPVRQPPRPNPDLQADVDHLDLFLICNTMSPERNLYADIKSEQYCKQLRFLTFVRDFDDPEKGYEFGRAFAKEVWDDAQALNRLAWATLTEDGIETRDLAFVLKAARRANELAEFKDADLLNTLARTHHDKGELEAALKWARQAVERVDDSSPDASRIRAAFERYQARVKQQQE